jgi:integrase
MSRGLTVKEVEALRFERDGHRVADRDGLYVRLTPAGGKSFQLRATLGQERPWITLGNSEALTLAGARELGAKVRELLDTGVSLSRIRAALQSTRSARALEAHLPNGRDLSLPRWSSEEIGREVGGEADVMPMTGRAPRHASGRAAAAPLLSDLHWSGGVRGLGWVSTSNGQAVPFPAPKGSSVSPAGRSKPAANAARPFARLTPASTVHEATVAWFEWKRPGLRNGKHVDQNWNTMRDYVLPVLGRQPVAQVRRKDVIDLLWPIWREKHETARRVQGRLREVFELAVAEELREDNPAAFDPKVALGRVRTSTRHHASLPPDTVQDFWDWLLRAPCSESTRGFIQLLLLTARRTSEARFVTWGEFRLGRRSWDELASWMERMSETGDLPLVVWETSAAKMKMNREHRTPLSRQAIQVVLNLRRLAPAGVTKDAYVFASRTRSGTISENTALKQVKTYDPGLTGHGLRATFKTWAKEERWDDDLVEFALAHVQEKLDAAYQRSDLLEQRRPLMQAWADAVTQGRDVPEPGQADHPDEGDKQATDRQEVPTHAGMP